MRTRCTVVGLILTLSLAACGPRTADDPFVAQIRELPEAGSEPWDDEVKRLLLERFDADGSGWLDTPQEIAAVPCATWQGIDRAIAEGGRWDGLRAIYGFAEGYLWVGGAIGVQEPMRADADAALERCGVPQ